MDFVDQDTGDQIRYHRIRKRVRVFHNGQCQGSVKPSWRCCAACRTCLDEVQGRDVPLVTLFDKSGHDFAKITRPGKGCCCNCHPVFPMRCVYGKILALPLSFFVCCSCTCESWPGPATLSGCPAAVNGIPTCGCPHGCLFCDPVCCDCCVKGSIRAGGCSECPVCCCPNPCGCIACCCCRPSCVAEELPSHSTFKYDEMELTKNGAHVGRVQLQYRGNFPFQTGHQHDTTKPHTAAVEVGTGGSNGLVSSAVLVARSYALGAVAPLLEGFQVASSSPGYDGYVSTYRSDEVDALLKALNESNVVTAPLLIGPKGRQSNLHGYTLIEVGYDNAWFSLGPCVLGGGASRKPIRCTNKAKTLELVNNGREGGTRPTFTFRFRIEDPEHGILSRKAGAKVDENWYDFYNEGREQVFLACTCIRCCRFPADCTINKFHCCKLPVYTRDAVKVLPVVPAEEKQAKIPKQVIMRPCKKLYLDP